MILNPDDSYKYVEHRVDAVKYALSVGKLTFYNCLTEQLEKC